MTLPDPDDFHRWVTPQAEPCPGCPCCAAALCDTAAARELPCSAIGAGPELDGCRCAALATMRRELARVITHDPSHPDNAGRWSVKDAEREYRPRNAAVMGAALAAVRAGLPVGIDRDPADPVHPVVLTIELPTGQATWHLPDHPYSLPPSPRPWDGHDTAVKYDRVAAWLAGHE